MSQAVELPEKVWSALRQAAKVSGVTPADCIAAHLPAPADANEVIAPIEEESTDDLEPPTYNSVPLERVGAVQVVCVAGKEVPPPRVWVKCQPWSFLFSVAQPFTAGKAAGIETNTQA